LVSFCIIESLKLAKEKSNLFKRASGILLHPTSLPGRFGIGDLGTEAFHFVDFLKQNGQHLWQMLPLGPIGLDNSPYQGLSTFAGNELLISMEKLLDEKLLESSDLESIPEFPSHMVDYDLVSKYKSDLLKKSFEIFAKNSNRTQKKSFEDFCSNNYHWLNDYALFRALKEAFSDACWNTWDYSLKMRQSKALDEWSRKLEKEILTFSYQQFQFFKQWTALKTYANKQGISLVGDIPIFVALDSAEVWSHPELFYLNAEGKPTVVAGVPPDYFSSAGQLWGNPLYRWDFMALDGYKWWIERLKAIHKMVDIIRVDHFRGFADYWEIPATSSNAVNGRWVSGPGAAFFEAVQEKLGKLPIIAEDLGIITAEVEQLRDKFEFPGMRVMQFGFGDDCGNNIHRPINYPPNCVAYTGTHDNDTTIGWFEASESEVTTVSREAREKEKQRALCYLGTDGHEINWDFIHAIFMSDADTAIIPLQDVLGLGSEARINVPGRQEGNWSWRFSSGMLGDQMGERLKELTLLAAR
jgi:4-alpha-glucanotransferase